MPVYEYRCPSCGMTNRTVSPIKDYDPDAKPDCIDCRVQMARVFDPLPFQMPMPGHFNNSLGRYVTGKRDFQDGLKVASEEATERNGIPHNFVMVDGRDHEAAGVTGEGLHETQRARDVVGKKPLDLPFST